MGNMVGLVSKYFTRETRKIIITGLDAAGKTTFLYKLKLGQEITTIPTIGFNAETVEYKNIQFTAWDIGGEDKIRTLEKYYYQDKTDIIFFVDSNDKERIYCAKEELYRILKEDCVQGLPLLIFANKQDLPNAMTKEEIEQVFELNSVDDRPWFVQPSSCLTGDGLYEGLDWLASPEVVVAPQRFQQTKSARK